MGPRGERGDRRRRGEDEGRYGPQPASLPAGADPSPQCTSPGPGPRVRALARRAEAAGPAPGSRARMAGSAPGSRGPGSPRRMLTWALRGPPLRAARGRGRGGQGAERGRGRRCGDTAAGREQHLPPGRAGGGGPGSGARRPPSTRERAVGSGRQSGPFGCGRLQWRSLGLRGSTRLPRDSLPGLHRV